MKQVFSDATQVAHLWANKVQSEAKNSGHNFYFHGDTIYSYGSHFPIAKHLDGKVIMTNRTYSNTTAKHIGMVRSAASHLDKLYCFDIPYNKGDKQAHEKNVATWLNNIENEAKKLLTARKPENYVAAINGEIEQLNKYVAFFGIKLTASQKKVISIQGADGFKDLVRKQVEAKKAFEKTIQVKGVKLYDKSILAWKNYNETEFRKELTDKQKTLLNAYVNTLNLNTVYLRSNGDELETSKGVKIPLAVAKRYYNWYNSIKVAGCVDCGYKMLDYEVKQANADGLIIGCHNISIGEINAIAIKNNW